MRRLKDLNIISISKHIWDLFSTSDSLWVAWVKVYFLRNNSFWNVRIYIFYGYKFIADVWKEVLRKCCVFRHPWVWANELLWAIHNLRENSFATTIKKMAWAATISYVWHERSRRLHDNVFRPFQVIIAIMEHDIRYRAMGFTLVKDNLRNRTFCLNWGISCDIFY